MGCKLPTSSPDVAFPLWICCGLTGLRLPGDWLRLQAKSLANLLQPWPLKIVLDNVLGQHKGKLGGWLNHFIERTAGTDPFAVLQFACCAVILMAVMDAVCTYTEKYLTTSVGQWATHDLRRAVYAQVQRLSMRYHDQVQTGA